MIVVPIAIVQALAFFILHGLPPIPTKSSTIGFGFLLLLGILIHELIHVAAWAGISKKPLSVFKLGFQWQSLTPYAHCMEPMDVRSYRLGSFAPGFLLGILPWTVSLFTGDILLFLFGLLFTTAAGGDFLILWVIRGLKPGTLVEDHPFNAGCYIIEQ
jgi:hypothetical protein